MRFFANFTCYFSFFCCFKWWALFKFDRKYYEKSNINFGYSRCSSSNNFKSSNQSGILLQLILEVQTDVKIDDVSEKFSLKKILYLYLWRKIFVHGFQRFTISKNFFHDWWQKILFCVVFFWVHRYLSNLELILSIMVKRGVGLSNPHIS